MSKKINKLFRSLIKIISPTLFKILLKLKLNRRVINFLNEKSYNSNNEYNFISLIEKLLKNEKILALDVGAQGGFNSDLFFPKKYNIFFDEILIEPLEEEAKKLKDKKYVINKGLWNKREKKKVICLR